MHITSDAKRPELFKKIALNNIRAYQDNLPFVLLEQEKKIHALSNSRAYLLIKAIKSPRKNVRRFFYTCKEKIFN